MKKLICILFLLAAHYSYGQVRFSGRPIDTIYTTVDTANKLTTWNHFIVKAEGVKTLGDKTTATIWKITDSARCYNEYKFMFLEKVNVTKQYQHHIEESSLTATIYKTSGERKTCTQQDGKDAIIKYYDEKGKLVKKEKAKYTDDFYNSVKHYFLNSKTRK